MDDLVALDARESQTWKDKTNFEQAITDAIKPVIDPKPPVPSKNIAKRYRNVLFQQKKLRSSDDVNEYVEELRKSLNDLLKTYDGIDIE